MRDKSFFNRSTQMLIISVFLVFVASSCSKSDTESDKEADQVSIYKLLLYPERYHKKRVKTIGFYEYGIISSLYPYEDDMVNRFLFRSMVVYNVKRAQSYELAVCDGNYVELEGLIVTVETGTSGRVVVYLVDVTEVNMVVREGDGSVDLIPCILFYDGT
ncbi:hypothetical protein CWE11_11860 [Aliidiomarina sanyensis]|uniref:Lipoprotein n=1 Tax=Aliidiomarina sanyensis TaxID=1249555 RepID=A0A432W518_9GAMM|nr:hypothetical protein CWE11_11860 [Aliidiomarina sanyensis]